MNPSPTTPKGRMAHAIRFTITSGKRRDYTRKTFPRALRGWLACRDVAYPQETHEHINVRQLYGIFAHYAQYRRHAAPETAKRSAAA
jgi:hypothetical protein